MRIKKVVQSEQSWVPKAGEWVKITSDRYTNHRSDKDPVFQIDYISGNRLHSKSTGREGWINAEDVVKALPHEIPAKKEWIPKAGEWAYILGIGHTEDNEMFPKGKVFKIKSISNNKHLYVDKDNNPHNVSGTCTYARDCRKAYPHEIPTKVHESPQVTKPVDLISKDEVELLDTRTYTVKVYKSLVEEQITLF